MPKIVDKIEKRKKIAKSTCGLFIEKGFVNISVSQIAQVAGIGKGTVYEYFKNKEDIVFEIMSCLQSEYDPSLFDKIKNSKNAKEKLIHLFDIYLSDDEKVTIQRSIYKEFLAILLNNPSEEMTKFHSLMIDKYCEIVKEIFTEDIEKDMLLPISIDFIPSIFSAMNGFFISNESKEQMLKYLDSLFEILEVRK